MPTSSASVIATVVATLGVISGAIMSNKQAPTANLNIAVTEASIIQAPVITDIDAHAHGETIEEVRMHHRKPGAETTLISQHSYSLEKNELKTIELEVEVPPVQGFLKISLKADTALEISGETEFEFTTGNQRSVKVPVQVRALQDGEYPIHVFTHFTDEYGNSTSRAMGVAAQVGLKTATKLHAKHQAKISHPIEFIKLPSEETIR